MADMTSPPHQQTADTTPALRGPARSSQPPHSAAEQPSSTKNSVYIQPMVEMRQSQLVVNSSATRLMSAGQASGWAPPTTLDSGNQNTEKP
ncbi:hypothetical protein D3C86_1114910 [compost metagenome]